MYRLLEVGEVIENGDEYYGLEDKWLGFPPSCIGMKAVPHDAPIRRLIKPAVTPAALPDPVVSVGDRVKVLSGPWAGCTGVVTTFEAEVTLSGYGKMTAKYDSTPVIELDNVRAGGHKLILNKVTVEPLPPVVPEVLYRDLSHGEIVKAGDQFWSFGYGPWVVAGPEEIGNTITHYKARHRRPVRLQSPGWRYLDAGETVQSGDEVWSGLFNRYVPASADRGSVVNDEKLFRRKLPANQGG